MVQVFADKIQGVDADALRQAIEPILSAHHVETAELTHQREQGGWVLRITVEALESGAPKSSQLAPATDDGSAGAVGTTPAPTAAGPCAPAASGIEPAPTAAGIEPAPTAAGIEPAPTAAGIEPAPTAAGIEPAPTAAGIEPAPTAAGIEPAPTAAGIEPAPTAAGIEPAPTAAGIEPAPTAAGIEPAPTAAGIEPAPTAAGIEPAPTAAGIEPAPTAAGPCAPAASGIELSLLTEISRDLSTALDVADVIPHRYTLEVSSPGLERPLRRPRDFQQAVGCLAKVYLSRPAPDGQRVLRGRVLRVEDPEAVIIEVDGKPMAAPLTDIARAHTLYELPAQPKRNRATKNKRH